MSAPRAVAIGVLLGAVALAAVVSCGPKGFAEVEEFRDLAAPAEIALWQGEWDRRASRWSAFPDPPGEGPVVTTRFWLSRAIYEMEVRRRGERVTLGIHGVDVQTMGGGWTAFGEGRITGPPDSFAGAVATISWSCLGIRHRHASDGVARLWFSADGREVSTIYVAHEEPSLWSKAYGRVREGPKPAYASLRGQIPFTEAMDRLPPDQEVRRHVRVVDDTGAPVADALVQVKGVDRTRLHADETGRAVLVFRGKDAPLAQVLCAGAVGHLNGETALFPDDDLGTEAKPAEIRLVRLDPKDRPEYRWNHPAPDADPDDAMACATCHSWHYDQWQSSRHARSADHGHVEWERNRMRARDPKAPDDCRGCHQPAHAVDNPGDGWSRRGVLAGVHCDLCHKIRAVRTPGGGGVFGAIDLLRPDPASTERPGGIHHVFGASPDVTFAYMGASYAPIFQASHLCAGCHQGGGRTDLGLPKIDTFEEWRAWAAERQDERFRSCQDCHMPGGTTVRESGEPVDQFAWDATHRRPGAVHSHRFEGTGAAFAAKALDLRVEKRRDGATGEWVIEVILKNVGAGHRIPTGTWSKHVAVGVWARAGGTWLRATGGDRALLVPGDPPAEALAAGDWRNPPGGVLGVRPKDPAHGSAPAPFWGAWSRDSVVDERLAPGEERRIVCRFEAPGDAAAVEAAGGPEVEVRVVHRRGEIGTGPSQTPWELRPYDPPPETLWIRWVR